MRQKADDYTYLLFLQDLPSEEIKEELIENGQAEEILQKSCPAEYSGLKEEEVTPSTLSVVYIFYNWIIELNKAAFSTHHTC